jgi:hypothetical protein
VPVIVPLEPASDALSAFSTERVSEPVRERPSLVESRPHSEHDVPLVNAAAALPQNHDRQPRPVQLVPLAFVVGVLAGVAGSAGLGAARMAPASDLAVAAEHVAAPLVSATAMAPCAVPAAAGVTAQPSITPSPVLTERPVAVLASGAATAAAAPAPRIAPAVPAAGALSIASPFVVQAFVDGTLVGDSASARLNVPAGAHELRLVSDALEFVQVTPIDVKARALTRLVVERPLGTLHVNAQPWAEVWVDGRKLGDTPLGNVRLPIGAHDVTLRHPSLGEERRTVTIGARTPVHLGVEFPR